MTVATETAVSVPLNWTGVEASFAAGFAAKSAAYVRVISRDAAGVDTLLTQGVHFSVTLGGDGAVTVVPIALPAAPRTLFVYRQTPATQGTNFSDLAGGFPARTYTDLFDVGAMRDAELRRDIARASLSAIDEPGLVFPSLAARANGGIGSVMGFAADGSVRVFDPHLGTGNVMGPAGAVNNGIALFDTAGSMLKSLAAVAVGSVLISGGINAPPAYSATLPSAVQDNITRLGTIAVPVAFNGAVTLGSTLNRLTLTPPAAGATLTVPDGSTVTFQGTDTYVGRATTDTLTNKSISLASNTLTATSAQLASAISDETGTGPLVFAGSPALVTPNLGTPSAVTLTNATGLPIGTGVSGLAGGIAAFLATPSSANLRSAVTDETGTGPLVFGTAPALTQITSTSASFAASAPTLAALTLGGNFGGGLVLNDTGRAGIWTESFGTQLKFGLGASVLAPVLALTSSGGDLTGVFTVNTKLPFKPSFTSYFAGASGGSSSTNNAAVLSAEGSAFSEIFVPEGTFTTTKDFLGGTDVTKQYKGVGTLIDGSGNRRGQWWLPVSTAITAASNYANHATWYNGDWSKSAIKIEQVYQNATPQQTGALTTSASTAAGSAVLTFSSVPSWIGVGAGLSYRALQVTHANIPAGAYVVAAGPTTVTLSANVTGGGVANGDTVRFGSRQYITIPETAPISIYTLAQSGSLGGTSSESSTQNVYQISLHARNDSGSAGAIWPIGVLSTVTRAWSGYNSANQFSTPQAGILTGICNTEVDGVYLAPVEYETSDQGHQTTAIALVLDLVRTYSGSVEHATRGQFWNAIRLNVSGGASNKAVDAGIYFGGPYVYGLDFTGVNNTPTGAIALKQDQKILFNASSPDTLGANSAGNWSLKYDSGVSQLMFATGGNTLALGTQYLTLRGAANPGLILNAVSGATDPLLVFQQDDTSKWQIYRAGADNSLRLYSNVDSTAELILTHNKAVFAGSVTGAGAIRSTGLQAAPQASSIIMDTAAGAGRIISFGADNSTKGTLSIFMRTANESAEVTALTIATSGVVTLPEGVAITKNPTVGPSIDTSGIATVSATNGGNSSVIVTGTTSFVMIVDQTNFNVGVYLVAGGTVQTLMGAGGSVFVAPSSGPAAGKASFAYDGSTGNRVYNNMSVGTVNFRVSVWKLT